MSSQLDKIFKSTKCASKLKDWLPYFFQMAEIECSRAGKIGMEVGSVREKIIISFLIYQFGSENVNASIPITKSEIDVEFFGMPISIKTMTGKRIGPLKLIWTVDAKQALEFRKKYNPAYDILLTHINWDDKKNGALYHFPLEAQKKVFKDLGRKAYIKLPKAGTNPRGVEMSKEASRALSIAKGTQKIEIKWEKKWIPFDPHQRWVDCWKTYAKDP